MRLGLGRGTRRSLGGLPPRVMHRLDSAPAEPPACPRPAFACLGVLTRLRRGACRSPPARAHAAPSAPTSSRPHPAATATTTTTPRRAALPTVVEHGPRDRPEVTLTFDSNMTF